MQRDGNIGSASATKGGTGPKPATSFPEHLPLLIESPFGSAFESTYSSECLFLRLPNYMLATLLTLTNPYNIRSTWLQNTD